MALTREQRLTLRLTNYWNLIRKDKPFPRIEQFNFGAIAELWPDCVQVRLHGGGKRPVFWCEYMGDAIRQAYGKDMTNQILEYNTYTFPGVVMYSKLNEIAASPAPMDNNGHMMNEKGEIIKYRACFLPFCSDKRGLTHIVIGLSFRLFH